LTLAGPSGILLGPLVVRLAKEVVEIANEERERKRGAEAQAQCRDLTDRAS
jgi:hypothetical protein